MNSEIAKPTSSLFQFRPKSNPLSWPLTPPAKDPSAAPPAKKDSVGGAVPTLNPNVAEFVPSFGGGGANPGMTPFSAVSLARNMDKG